MISEDVSVQTAPLHARFTADAHDGPQKIRQNITPRIGGVAMFVAGYEFLLRVVYDKN